MNLKYLILSAFVFSYTAANTLNQSQEQLHQAILNNSGEQVQQTITTVSTQGLGNETAEWFLLRAIMKENAEEIKAAVQQLITEGKNGNSPVIWAALLRKPNSIKPLLECGAKLNANIVKYAIKVGDLKTALVIIRSGIEISDIMQDCMQLSLTYANNNNIDTTLEFIQELINHGYNVNNAWRFRQLTNPFDIKILKLFIENGINPNQILTGHHDGETPLLMATQMHNKQAMEMLLKAGAIVTQPGKVSSYSKPVTPLFLAVAKNDIEAVALLLNNGANIQQAIKTHVNALALTPLALAVERGNSPMVELLLERGAQY